MLKPLAWSFLVFSRLALGHGGHDHSGPAQGETIQQYAQRHMSKEHHIDTFDIRSFFHLHDLNRDGFWDREEIEAVYGVHHVYSQRKTPDEIEHQKKADHIVNTVLGILDLNKDGKVSPKELEKVGLDGLPNFEHMGAEGHHYDEESEFFLHHEEEFHSTPETQTDEAYNHPEDLEHFAHHEKIEKAELEREAKFQGVTVEELVKAQLAAEEAAERAKTAVPENAEATPAAGDPAQPPQPPRPQFTRVPPPEKQDPAIKYKSAKEEGARGSQWGEGPEGYKAPVKPAEKMRKNLPYKYKFRRNWGDF
ncbi:hypothetical protein CC1G_00564 [Coprinopsis cinerea okayama7|uniref:EF-hand domain-containing protein n=1 Tax=Coprinopsis cinerea (strain Okayama-7 / 130 / ATCC MYA-4618 / FGSC 9003) TaxID=240176 RepID=A8N3V2_COPC7|nr:hypothetical protein CC1G_00564 [Coprinopsis cinerea okayama7\|eukprot:XP_001829385.1 hypothetical protein CC1G_00564 [Coprinopsis cinerea okayama7\